MKRTAFLMAYSVAIAAIFSACTKDQQPLASDNQDQSSEVVVPNEAETISIQFTAHYPATQVDKTKTTISEDGTVEWVEGDEITLYYLDGVTPSHTTARAISSGKSAQFSATIPTTVTNVYAIYPAGAATLDSEGKFTVHVIGNDGSFAKANYAVGWTEIGENTSISLKNVVGLLRVPLPENGVLVNGDSNYTLSAIKVTAKEGTPAFAGDVAVSVEDGNLVMSEPTNVNSEASIALSPETRSGDFAYIPVLPFTASNGLVFRFEDTEGTAIPAAVSVDGKAVTLERGHLKHAPATPVWTWYFSADGTGDGKTVDSPAGVEAFQKMLDDTKYTYGQWRLNGAVLRLADGKYALTKTISLQGTESGTIRIDGTSQGGTWWPGVADNDMGFCYGFKYQ